VVLAAKIAFDELQVVADIGCGAVGGEDAAAGLLSQLREGLRAWGAEGGGLFGAEGVDGGVGVLACVDGLAEAHEAGVVFAVGEKQDEVAAGGVVDAAELGAAGAVEGVEDGGAGDAAFAACGDPADSFGEGGFVAGPGLKKACEVAEVHDEGLVGLLTQEGLGVLEGDGAVGGEVWGHGGAGVHEDAGADGEVLEGLEGENFAGWVAVVAEGEIGEFEVVDGEVVSVGGVEGEVDFVYGDGEGEGGVLRLGVGGRCDQ